MTRGPRRLKDDPDFKWETGCDIRDEELLVGNYDLEGARSRLLAAIALASPTLDDAPSETGSIVGDGVPAVRPGPGRTAWNWKAAVKPVAAAVTGVLVVAGAYWLGTQAGSDVVSKQTPKIELSSPQGHTIPLQAPEGQEGAVQPSAPAPMDATSQSSAAAGTADAEPAASRPALHAEAVRAEAVRTEPARSESGEDEAPKDELSAPALPPEIIAAQQAALPSESAPSAPGTAEAPEIAPSSTLPLELDAMEKANTALYEGRYREARTLFEAYLADFPKGRQRDEAQFGRLQAAFGQGDVAATESIARSIQDLPSLSGRRIEIMRLRAESLVLLGRCEEALHLADEIPSKAAAEVRRTCRRSGKGSP